MIPFLSAQGWKLATAAAGIAAIAMGLTLTVTTARLHAAERAAAALTASIDAPVTGWAARLATCQANEATVRGAIETQNRAIEAGIKACR